METRSATGTIGAGRVRARGFAALVLGLACCAGPPLAALARGQHDAPDRPKELLVFAAASLADALAEIGTDWQAQSGTPVVFNFAGSNELARQIRAGAPADVYFSADEAQMDVLARDGLVRAGECHHLLSNTLVVIVPGDSAAVVSRAEHLAQFGSLALADPQAVPAGVYARRWLEGRGLWSTLQARVVPAIHVRAALAAVESGNVAAGIVYRTDAARSRRARIVYQVEPGEAPTIRYPAAPLASSTKPAAAAFVAHLRSQRAGAVFVRHGFLVLGGP